RGRIHPHRNAGSRLMSSMTPVRQSGNGNGGGAVPLSALRRFVRRQEPEERGELGSEPLSPPPAREHLLEVEPRNVLCSCTPCALLFPPEAEKRYRRVSRRLWYLRDFVMTDAQWESLAITDNMAFLQRT